MNRKFNKRSMRKLVSSTTLIGTLFFSSSLAVSAEEIVEPTSPIESVEETTAVHETVKLSENKSEDVLESVFDTYASPTNLEDSGAAEVEPEDEVLEEEEMDESLETVIEDEAEEVEEIDEALEHEEPLEELRTEEKEVVEESETSGIAEKKEHHLQSAPVDATVARTNVSKKPQVERVDGSNRFEVAANISKQGWQTSDVVFLVNGYQEADALAGSPLASLYDAPILYSSHNNVPSATLNEIKRLGAKKVVVLGGTKSVPVQIENTLKNNNVTVERIDGSTRYHVASAIAQEIMKVEGSNRDAFLVNGEAFADALSIAPIAASKRLPIFLTNANGLHLEVKNAIPYIHSWTIIGGDFSIPTSLVNEMISLGATIKNRFEGSNRYAVNRNVIDYYGNSKDYIYVASGEVFSDALTTSVLAGEERANILLVKNNNIKTLHEQTKFIKDKKGIEDFILVGGPLTLSSITKNHFVEPVVYLDPGHGGAEPGTAHYGIVEKNLNLSISNRINQKLEDYGYKVVMSRTTDKYVDIYDRPKEANRLNADIFVSVHNNAMPGNSTVSGIETYYYQHRASDTYKPQYNQNSSEYAKAISPQRATNSLKLANAIHRHVVSSTGAPDRGVREMSFAVIRETFMPAVLLELGYVSNYNEAQKLNTPSYQNTLAHAVVSGINAYFNV